MHNGMRTILAATILIGALCALAASALATEPGENMLTNSRIRRRHEALDSPNRPQSADPTTRSTTK